MISSSNWSYEKLLFSTKSLTSPPVDPAINYAIFHKKIHSSSSWFFNKPCYFSQKIQLLIELIFRKPMLFSARGPTPSPADYQINHVIFHKKSNSSSSWTSDKLCYFPHKNATPPPADPPINYVMLHKKCNSSSSQFSNKLCSFPQKTQLLVQLILR